MANIDTSTPQLKVAKRWLDAYSSLNASELDPLLSKHYKHQPFPKSIYPEETKEEHIKRYGGVGPSITELEFNVREVIEAPGKVVFHSTATCSVHGTTFTSDTACILSLVEEDGELKILQAKTFSDPQQHTAIDSLIAVAKGAAVA